MSWDVLRDVSSMVLRAMVSRVLVISSILVLWVIRVLVVVVIFASRDWIVALVSVVRCNSKYTLSNRTWRGQRGAKDYCSQL